MKPDHIENLYRLSPMQEGMLFHSLYDPEGGLYVEQSICTLTGELDPEALRQAWQRAIERHPVLRSAFHWQGLEAPLQVVVRRAEAPWEEKDWRHYSAAGLPARLEELTAADRRRGFELETPPLVRFTLVRLGDRRWRFLWSFHHLLLDGWSTPLLLAEVFATYRALRRGQAPQLASPRPYADYIGWLQAQDMAAAESYWRRALAGLEQPGRVPLVGPPSEEAVIEHREHRLLAPRAERLATAARHGGLTLATVALGAWALLLGRYGNRDDVVFGAVTSGRPPHLDGAETIVGMLINTLPVRVVIEPWRDALSWLGELQSRLQEQQRFEHSPLAEIQRWSPLPAGTALFDTLVAFENYPRDPALLAGDPELEISDLAIDERTNYPLNLSVAPLDGELWLKITFDRSRLDPAAAERLLGHLATLLDGIAEDPARPLATLPLLNAAERRHLVGLNATAAPPPEVPVDVAFRRRAKEHRDTVAVVAETAVLRQVERLGPEEHWSYGELARRAHRMAHRLAHRLGRRLAAGAGREAVVALCLERSPSALVAQQAVLAAGGVCLPLDPDDPPARLRAIMADAGAALLVTRRGLAERCPPPPEVPVLLTDGPREGEAPGAPSPGELAPGEPTVAGKGWQERLAYVIYTSGSTGSPKGVMVPHGGLANTIADARRRLGVGETSRMLQAAALTFDASLLEALTALSSGARLWQVHPATLAAGAPLLERLAERAITVAAVVPSLLDALPGAALPALSTLCVGGERCSGETAARWAVGRRLLNLYAPTEASIYATAGEASSTEGGAAPALGEPIANAQAWVLDRHLALLPHGVAGEICLGGAGLARGYRGRPAETAHRFVPHPLAAPGERGSRLYRSGDRGRVRPDGALEFLGRLDRQIKVRGFRVEPGEIEAALASHPAIGECAVVPSRGDDRPPQGAPARLVAWLLAAGDGHDGEAVAPPPASELRAYLATRLPGYMVPHLFATVAEMPRTATGKLDRRALERRAVEPQSSALHRPPRTEIEQRLAEIWGAVLGVAEPGVDDGFFDLGGDSILSIQIVSRAAEAGIQLTPRQLFEHPTIAQLAAVAKKTAAGGAADDHAAPGPVPLTPIQSRFFELELAEPGHWNMALLLAPAEALDAARLEAALTAVVAHHDALRLRFTPGEAAGWEQELVTSAAPMPLDLVDLGGLSRERRQEALERAATGAQRGLDLARGPLLRAVLFERGPSRRQRLLIVIHHLAVDAVSWRILLEDLERAYRQLEAAGAAAAPIHLPPVPTSFKRWAETLSRHAASDATRAELAWWLAAAERATPLPRNAGGSNREADGESVVAELDGAATRALLTEANEAYGTRPEELLLTALAQELAAWIGGRRLLIDLEGHGREELEPGIDLSRTVGWLTSLYPVGLEIDPGAAPGEAIKAVKEQLRRVPRRGIGFGLLRHLTAEGRRRLAALPSPEVAFNYLGRIDRALAGSTLAEPALEPTGPAHSPRARRDHLLEINAFVSGDRLTADLRYSAAVHDRSTMERLAAGFGRRVQEIVEHCLAPDAGAFTPSDFPAADIDQTTLDRFLERLAEPGLADGGSSR